jgi:hypothetical protein
MGLILLCPLKKRTTSLLTWVSEQETMSSGPRSQKKSGMIFLDQKESQNKEKVLVMATRFVRVQQAVTMNVQHHRLMITVYWRGWQIAT